MLLYDRVREHAERYVKETGKQKDLLQAFKRAKVFEITNLFPILDYKVIEKPVHKRPPFELTWVEWLEEENKDHVITQSGCLILKREEHNDIQISCEEMYVARLFHFGIFKDTNETRLESPITSYFWGFNDESKKLLIHVNVTTVPNVFGLKGNPSYAQAYVPAMAFALLHCKNIVTVDNVPDEQLQRRVAKSGNPPRTTYKTLQLTLPRLTMKKTNSEPTGIEQRFHIVSGHFKHLTNPRYKNPGLYWWPEHYKGNPDLGTVVKNYKVGTHGS